MSPRNPNIARDGTPESPGLVAEIILAALRLDEDVELVKSRERPDGVYELNVMLEMERYPVPVIVTIEPD